MVNNEEIRLRRKEKHSFLQLLALIVLYFVLLAISFVYAAYLVTGMLLFVGLFLAGYFFGYKKGLNQGPEIEKDICARHQEWGI